MASSLETEKLYYRYEIIKNVWTASLRRKGDYGGSTKASSYFNNFVARHRTLQFSIMKIFDGTRHIMVEKEHFEKIRRELETMTGATFPDINPYEGSDSRNVIERQRFFTTQQQLDGQLQDLESENSKIYSRARQDAAEHKSKLCQVLREKKHIKFLCFDLEVHEKDRKTILEIGYVKFTLNKEGDKPEYFHAVVNEELHNREGFDNKEKFQFGTTVRMPLEEAAEELKKGVEGSDALLTHSGYNDKQYLADNGIDIEEKPMFDTQMLALNLLQGKIKCWGLKRMMDEMSIRYDESILHNAGNDAHYTMMAFKALVKRAMPLTKF